MPKSKSVSKLIKPDIDPFVPENWKVEEHIKSNQFEWDGSETELYFDSWQGHSIDGYELREKLAGKKVMNACVLDHLLAHPELVPSEWRDKEVCFWGTIYSYPCNRLCVRCLYWNGDKWCWSCKELGSNFDLDSPVVVSNLIKPFTDVIVRTVTVKYGRYPDQAIAAAGCYEGLVLPMDVRRMPGDDINEVDDRQVSVTLTFFNVGRELSDEGLQEEYKKRGLKPADPYALAAVNEGDHEFIYRYPNATHWKDCGDNWCYAAFYPRKGLRTVNVAYNNYNCWEEQFWFAGVPRK